MTAEITVASDLDYLMDGLRVHLWDLNTPPTYSDGFLRFALLAGLKLLMPRWNSRYVPRYENDYWYVDRNPNDEFEFPPPPSIQYGDERPIILAAAISIKTGLLFTIGGNAVSWRDEEISFSNLTGAELQKESVIRDWEELNKLVPERRQRLARPRKQSLLGFRSPSNSFEG